MVALRKKLFTAAYPNLATAGLDEGCDWDQERPMSCLKTVHDSEGYPSYSPTLPGLKAVQDADAWISMRCLESSEGHPSNSPTRRDLETVQDTDAYSPVCCWKTVQDVDLYHRPGRCLKTAQDHHDEYSSYTPLLGDPAPLLTGVQIRDGDRIAVDVTIRNVREADDCVLGHDIGDGL
ncbi:hypothetical protein H0H93_001111 [Arthromyces matolae]|nr:hypothetical protein H0H93_001111 [Arthromyces matolae]